MGEVFADLGMSLDGFIAGPNAGPENALGDGGNRIHEWQYRVAAWTERLGRGGGDVDRDNEIAEAGGDSPPHQKNAVEALVRVLPDAESRTLEGQTHDVAPEVLAAVLEDFFDAERGDPADRQEARA